MIYTFNKLMNVIGPINEELVIELYEELEVTGIGNKFYLAVEPNTISENVRYIGIPTESGSMHRIYEISQRKENEYEDQFTGVDFAIKDLQKDGVVIEFRNNGADFKTVIVNQILKGSSWSIGNIDFTAKTNESFYYQSRWDCLTAVVEELGCEVQMLVAISNNRISRRYINFFKQIGKDTQKRFEYGSNVLSVTKDTDESGIITKIYPRGKGEEIQDQETGQGTGNFTRRITIKDVEWKKSNGNPLDKPKGQEWLEDPQLTAMYPLHTGKSRTGVVIYEDCETPSELIKLGYETLKLNGVPKAEFKVVAPTDSILTLGDTVTVVNYERIYDIRTRIFKMKRFPLETFKNEYVFGDEVNRSAYKEVQNIINKNNQNLIEYVNGKVISAANGINKVYFGKEFPTRAMKGDFFYKYIGINEKGEQDIEMWEFDGSTWNKIVDTAMADADRLIKGRIDAGKINVINLNAANITTGILRGIRLEGDEIYGSNIYGGLIKGAQFVQTDPTGSSAPIGIFRAGVRFHKTEKNALEGTNPICGIYGTYYNTETLILYAGSTIMRLWGSRGAEIGADLKILGKSSFQGGDSWGALDMHGYPIYNQSDIRLKDNIEPVSFNGVAETKRIQMAEFDYKQNYDSRDADQQRPTERQFGVIAQSTPFLSSIPDESKNHYLSIDINKQVNLNTLTNQELIKIVEDQERRIKEIERVVEKLCKKD